MGKEKNSKTKYNKKKKAKVNHESYYFNSIN